MTLKNLKTLEVVTLPDSLIWSDEYLWTDVTSSVAYSVSGSLIIQDNVKKKGRVITLTSSPDMGWVQRSVVDKLFLWSQDPELKMLLTLKDGREYVVRFRHDETPISAENVKGFYDWDGSGYYIVTLSFREVE